MVARFWVYIGDKIQGPVDIPSLRKVQGFNLLTQVCLEGEQTWRLADEVIEIKSYFLSPPRLNSFTIDAGNAAPKLDLTPKPVLEELMLPEPHNLEAIMGAAPRKTIDPAATPAAAPSLLRSLCEVCGYKNPRDVTTCMKCGEILKKGAPDLSAASPQITLPQPAPVSAPAPIAFAPVTASPLPSPEPDPKASTMVEISMSKLLAGLAVSVLVVGGSFFGYRSWTKKHPSKPVRMMTAAAADAQPTPRSVQGKPKRYDRLAAPRVHSEQAATLPGVTNRKDHAIENAGPAEEKSDGASYKVIAEATPLQKRYSSPVKSSYAVKRRANEELWNTQEGRAIQQVQRCRIYGGQRTVQRNVEILMQILRDREYTAAFESGKGLSLYNDLDWSAVQTEGPVYEVRLTFSGGRQSDGTPKKPLHFAFAADLERGTVEPGGQDQIRSNTLHAFFDESRIAPEDRRAIAKDTEELVSAAQPGASPLAFDTVVRQFAKVYGSGAITRVAAAYGLEEVKKKLAHDPRLGSEDKKSEPAAKSPAAPSAVPVDSWVKAGMTMPPSAVTGEGVAPVLSKSKGGKQHVVKVSGAEGIEFQIETGKGHERTLSVQTVSHASVDRIWETLTGYDRLKQFVPDMLASEREGQDGAAAIVHISCLTHFMVFVFKLNLHLRVIEHPAQHTLEFERIAGDYESLRGSIEVTSDPATHETKILFHATVVPSGYMTNTKLESMARRLLVTQARAIRTKAESN